MDFSKNCPSCGCKQEYKSIVSYKKAIKENTSCKKCYFTRKSEEEREIVDEIIKFHHDGKTKKEIAEKLNISGSRVEYILKKNGHKLNRIHHALEIISDTEAKCSKCLEIKNIDQFITNRKNRKYEYKLSYCNTCRKRQVYLNLNDNLNSFLSDKYRRLVIRARNNNIPIDITKEEFIEIFNSQNGKCFYTDIEMIYCVGSGKFDNSISVDKIIPENGYIKGNIVLCCNKINTCKNNLSLEEIKNYMPGWYKRIMEFLNDGK